MSQMENAEDQWLEGGVEAVTMGVENGLTQEVDRVIELLSIDQSWLAWWRSISKAPVLEVHLIVVKADYEGVVEERVVRGRKRHLVEMRINSDGLEALELDERRQLALPAVLEGISRAQQALNLSGERPRIPDSVLPALLSEGTLRRRRLRELRGVADSPAPHNRTPDRRELWSETTTVRSVPRPEVDRLTPRPTSVLQGPSELHLVVEIHIPLNDAGGTEAGASGDEVEWVDDVEEFLADESSDGSFHIHDRGDDFGDAYICFISGAPEEILLRIAGAVAALPGVPPGVFAVITDGESQQVGNGRRVELSSP